MFSTVFMDISLIFVHLGLENFVKTGRDPPLLLPSREYVARKWKIVNDIAIGIGFGIKR